MFSKFKNIDTAFKQVKIVALVSILSTIGISAYVVTSNNSMLANAQEKIYVIRGNQVMEAATSNRKENFLVESKSHISNFHQYFFTLSPDDKFIQTTINKALYLADHSAKKQYDNLKESNYFSNVISANISQRITIDSILVNIDTDPYHWKCFAKQEITRPTSIVIRALITEGTLRFVERSENNPHGLLIEKWQITANSDVQVRTR